MTDIPLPPPVPAMPPHTQPPPVPDMPLDGAGVVNRDLPCRKCAYNIRGLAVTARCPECGAPVGVSVHGDLLRYSEPRWLQNLSSGAGFVFWGLLLSIAVSFVGGIVAQFVGPWVGPLFGIAGGIVYLYGAWLLTEPDPSGLGERQYGRARQIIRVALAASIVGQVLQFIAATAAPSPEVMVTFGIITMAAGLIGVVGQFAMLRYLERLARRIPDDSLSKMARTLFWGYGGALALGVLLGGAAAIAAATLGSTPPVAGAPGGGGPGPGMAGVLGAAAIFGCLIFIALLVFGIMFLVLLRRLQSAFSQQAHYARQVWGDAE